LQADTALSEDATRAMIKSTLGRAEFEFVRISDLQTSVGQQSRRGQAEFRVFTRGRLHSSAGLPDSTTAVTTWSLGFQETEPGVWKVSRISPVAMPAGVLNLPGGRTMKNESPFGSSGRGGGPRGRGRDIRPRFGNENR
jgi:hypothetical protein